MINQTKLLRAILLPQFLRENYSYLSPDLFDDPIEKIVSVAILFYFENYEELPPREDIETILYNKFTEKEEVSLIQRKLTEIYSSDDLQGLSFLSAQIREFVGKKRLRELCLTIEDEINNGEDIESILPDIYKKLSSLSTNRESIFSLHKEEDFVLWQDYREHIGDNRISTGYSLLDKRMQGGLGKGELFLVVVGPKGGKTTFMINLAANMLEKGLNGVYFTLELSHIMIYERFLKRMGNLTSADLDKLAVSLLAKDNIMAKLSNRGKLEIVKFPSLGATVMDLENKLLRMEKLPDFVVVDYLSELKATHSQAQYRYELAETGRNLRSLGDRLGFPVITAQQGNKESKKLMEMSSEDDGKRLMSGAISISECYMLTGIADVVFTLNQDEEDFEQGMMRGWISESRVGPSKGKPILFTVDYEKQLIMEVNDSFSTRVDAPKEETIVI